MLFLDGIVDLFNSLANRRNATQNNRIAGTMRIPFSELNDIYKTGIGNKIVRIKAGYATKSDAIIFESDESKEFYISNLQKYVKEAFVWCLVFGRGVIVINDGSDLSMPLKGVLDKDKVKFDVFSGDMVSVVSYQHDLSKADYFKPEYYNINGFDFHHSRVIDFTYLKATQNDRAKYNFGGISEFELIYNQIINDGVVERASASILEKNSSFFYKIKGFKQALQNKQEESIVKFYGISEDQRGIHGAGLIDIDDDVVSVSQSLTNLKDTDDISLRRLALVTGIPLPMLVGENVKGLNSSGQQEKTTFNEMIEILQQDYLLGGLRELFDKIGLGLISFRDNQNVTPLEKIEYENKAIDNALKLYDLGYDITTYLTDRGVDIKARDDFSVEFGEEDGEV